MIDIKDTDQVQGNFLRDLPEWLEDFTENLLDEGVSASRDTPASTSRDHNTPRGSNDLPTSPARGVS